MNTFHKGYQIAIHESKEGATYTATLVAFEQEVHADTILGVTKSAIELLDTLLIKPSFRIVTNFDDWEGLYVDGVLITEGHKVERYEILSLLNVDFQTLEVSHAYMDKHGSLPNKLSSIPKKHLT